ncbi:MAG: FAD-binding oxidoreductase [Chloroflexota bacterium]|nr:FAD-binding oxidoreductase [Chloroflexota bacterium]
MKGSSFNIAVIGGGIIGCAAAAYLAERGASVTLFERTAIGAGASGRNLGAVQHPFDPVLAALHHETLDLYRSLSAQELGFALPSLPAGLLLLNRDADAVRRQAERMTMALPELRPTFVEDVRSLEPALAPGLAACRLETAYPIPPMSATAALASLAERSGADLRVGVGARPWLSRGGTLGVVLEDGSRIAADAVLVAAGPWTPHLVDPTGAWEPIHTTWGVTLQLRLPGAPRHVVEEDEVDAVNRPAAATARAAASAAAEPPSLFSLSSANGVSSLGSTFLPGEPDPMPLAALLLRRAAAFLPSIPSAEILEHRICARPQSIDGRPFIGPVPDVEGLFVCAGHGPWGISTGPASARLVADLILDAGGPLPEEVRASRSLPS